MKTPGLLEDHWTTIKSGTHEDHWTAIKSGIDEDPWAAKKVECHNKLNR